MYVLTMLTFAHITYILTLPFYCQATVYSVFFIAKLKTILHGQTTAVTAAEHVYVHNTLHARSLYVHSTKTHQQAER